VTVNTAGELIIFQVLGECVDSSDTLMPAFCVMLDFSVIECTVVLRSGTSSRVIPVCKRGYTANDLYLIGIETWQWVHSPNRMA